MFAATAFALSFSIASCSSKSITTDFPKPEIGTAVAELSAQTVAQKNTSEITYEAPDPWTEEDVEAIVLTLAGECYDDKELDKRRVCEVILNRVSAGNFGGDTVLDVVTAPNQFDGYWTQSRSASENDYKVAKQALSDWYAGGCEPLSELLFFEAGENRENVFRSEY